MLGTGCIIGPYARVRPGSKLGANVHIGNFVELKKTEIADGSKANHLTYLGDAVIGKGVNVGAGTITCNYDGVNKSTTTIEDGAFIGSGNMLVAPVRIGKDATTGAGSTITKDAPDGRLTLHARQADDARRLEAAGEETEVSGANGTGTHIQSPHRLRSGGGGRNAGGARDPGLFAQWPSRERASRFADRRIQLAKRHGARGVRRRRAGNAGEFSRGACAHRRWQRAAEHLRD